MAAEEAALVARLAAGERSEPLAELYERYGRSLYGLGVRLTGDEGMAEEMVQETFVRLWRGAARFDPGKATLRTYLFTIARRVCVDLQRRSSSRPLPTLDAAPEDEPASSAAQDEAFDELLARLDLREALNSLSEKHREALEMHFHEDLTQRQIAERLDVPLGTVKTRTYHALRALKDHIEERDLVV